MSLELSGSSPKVEVKTYGMIPEVVHLHGEGIDIEIPLKDWLAATWYVLTNTDLYPEDPRLAFRRITKQLEIITGYAPDKLRLAVDGFGESLHYNPK
jgi:hypothetical protein